MLKVERTDFQVHPDWCQCGQPATVKLEAFTADMRFQRVGMCEKCAAAMQRDLSDVLRRIRMERVLGKEVFAVLEAANNG